MSETGEAENLIRVNLQVLRIEGSGIFLGILQIYQSEKIMLVECRGKDNQRG